MATNTYDALATVTAPGSGTSQLVMSSIPSNYTDLRMVVSGITSTTGYAFTLGVNGDTGSNYSQTFLSSNGVNAQGGRYSNSTTANMYLGGWVNGYDSTAPQTITVDFMDYANTTTFKSILWRSGVGSRNSESGVILWRGSTGSAAQAITSITVYSQSGSTIAAGSTFSLYGIRAEGVSPAPKATGGVIYSDSTYYYHVFGSTDVFTPLASLTADVLVVAGGGGASMGGGGAGGLLNYSSQSLSAINYTCTVGAGGTGQRGEISQGGDGVASTFQTLTSATGGGGGGDRVSTGTRNGRSGGSGGGGGYYFGAGAGGAASPSGQGNAGANSPQDNYAGGGGGSGVIGSGTLSNASGGNGLSTYSSYGVATGTGQNISGTYWYAGGGGGFLQVTSSGGNGGGGAGVASGTPNAGTPNTGGGGGGNVGSVGNPGGNGGSGIIVVRYLKA
jgi:hypothetical protein